jgi:uncharacterized protein YbaR (Trm112 family)
MCALLYLYLYPLSPPNGIAMTNEILVEIACPNCRTPIDVREHGRHVVCEACNSQFIVQGHLCPKCHAYYADKTSSCGRCGSAIERKCRKCQTMNWAGDEYCNHCGTAMDILDVLANNIVATRSAQLQSHNQQVRQMRRETEKASKERMAQFMDVEANRQQEVGRQRQLRRQKDQQLYALTAVIVLLVIALALFFLLT